MHRGIRELELRRRLDMSGTDESRYRSVDETLGNVLYKNSYWQAEEERTDAGRRGIRILKKILSRYGVEDNLLADDYLMAWGRQERERYISEINASGETDPVKRGIDYAIRKLRGIGHEITPAEEAEIANEVKRLQVEVMKIKAAARVAKGDA